MLLEKEHVAEIELQKVLLRFFLFLYAGIDRLLLPIPSLGLCSLFHHFLLLRLALATLAALMRIESLESLGDLSVLRLLGLVFSFGGLWLPEKRKFLLSLALKPILGERLNGNPESGQLGSGKEPLLGAIPEPDVGSEFESEGRDLSLLVLTLQLRVLVHLLQFEPVQEVLLESLVLHLNSVKNQPGLGVLSHQLAQCQLLGYRLQLLRRAYTWVARGYRHLTITCGVLGFWGDRKSVV